MPLGGKMKIYTPVILVITIYNFFIGYKNRGYAGDEGEDCEGLPHQCRAQQGADQQDHESGSSIL